MAKPKCLRCSRVRDLTPMNGIGVGVPPLVCPKCWPILKAAYDAKMNNTDAGKRGDPHSLVRHDFPPEGRMRNVPTGHEIRPMTTVRIDHHNLDDDARDKRFTGG